MKKQKSWYESQSKTFEKSQNQKFIDILLSGSRKDVMINHTKIIKPHFKYIPGDVVDLSKDMT